MNCWQLGDPAGPAFPSQQALTVWSGEAGEAFGLFDRLVVIGV